MRKEMGGWLQYKKQFLLFVVLIFTYCNLYTQNEYSIIRFPFYGYINAKYHQNIFVKDSVFFTNFSFDNYYISQNVFICDNNGDICLQYNDNQFYDKNRNSIINGNFLKINNIKLSIRTNQNCIFIRNNYKENEYFFIFLNDISELILLKIYKLNNKFIVDDNIIKFNNGDVKSFGITHHYNKKDYWVICKKSANQYESILIDEDLLLNQSNKYSSNNNYNKDINFKLECPQNETYCKTYLNISIDGKFIFFQSQPSYVKSNKNSLFHVINFDNKNGKFFNDKTINLLFFNEDQSFSDAVGGDESRNIFEIFSSPISNYIYLICNSQVYRFNTKCFEQNFIDSSINKINDYYLYLIQLGNIHSLLHTQLGQNHNMYISFLNDNNLIDGSGLDIHLNNNNNNLNSAFNNFLNLVSKDNNSLILDNHGFYTNMITKNNVVNSTFYQVRTDGVQEKCEGDDFRLDAEVLYELPDTNYRWTGPNGFIANIKNPFKNGITKKDEGIYTCEVFNEKRTTLYKGYIDLVVNYKPVFKIIPDNVKLICSNDKIQLICDQSFKKYLWSNGDTTRNTWIDKAGTYSLTTFNSENECSECSTTQSITIENAEPPEFEVVKDGEECGSSAVKLSCDRDFPNKFTYLWNTGATTKDISATSNGVYTLTVTDTNDCKTSKSITITFGQKPTASISATGPTTFCEGGKVELRASGGINANDLFFRWSTGETVPNITVTKSGIYRVVITHKFSQCVDSADVEINVNANLECKIVQNNGLCKGSKTTLIAEPQGIEYKYLWSTGETTPSIVISQGGQYSVEVSLDEYCKSSANIDVIENEVEEFEILAVGSFCVGDSVMLSASKEFASYEWSTGDYGALKGVTKSGTYTLKVIDKNGCRNEKSIIIEFNSPREYKLDFTNYDFGDVEIGAENRVKVNIPGEVGISIRGDFAYDMNTNEMVFSPDAERNYSGEIVLNYGGECDTSATILFVGRGVNSVRFKADVIAPTIETEAGLDNVELPFIFNINRDDLVYPFEMTYKMSFEINLDVFIPNFATTIVNDKRVVEVSGTALINKGENILTTILGDTYLSEFVDNPINIVDFEHNLPKTDIDKIDGNIRIVGICTQNLRAIKFRILTKLNITPNPTSDNLFAKVSTAEKGIHRLFLTSITGTKTEIKSFVVGDDLLEDTVFEQTFDINVSEMPEGTYILELQTPNQSITEKVLIVR